MHAIGEEDKGAPFVGKDSNTGTCIACVAANEGGSTRRGCNAIRPESCMTSIGASVSREIHEPDCPMRDVFCCGEYACVA